MRDTLLAGDQKQLRDWPGEEGEAESGEEAGGRGAQGKERIIIIFKQTVWLFFDTIKKVTQN